MSKLIYFAILRRETISRFPIIAVVIVASLAMFACGGSSDSDTISGSNEDGLESRAEAAAHAISNDDWELYHTMFSPDSKESCQAANFTAAADASMSSYRDFLGIAPTAKFEFEVTKVSVDGSDGEVTMDLHQGGERLNEGSPEPWVQVDGVWGVVNDDCQF